MATYYFGTVEFGDFVVDEDSYPLAIIRSVKDVKQFDDPKLAWDYYINNNKKFESYVSDESEDEYGRVYELAFKHNA